LQSCEKIPREDIVTELKKITDQINKTAYDDPGALQWTIILFELPRILTLGAQGVRKSCLGFWLLEISRI